MKYRVEEHFAAMAILLASMLPAQALDCLPDPDPACVFQMALLQADAEPKPEMLVLGYLTTAYLQKASGEGNAQFTLTVLGSKLQRRNLTPEQMNQAFGLGILGYALSPGWAPPDHDASLWVVEATGEMIQRNNPTKVGEATRDFNAPTEAERTAMRIRVAASVSDNDAKYSRLTAAGIPTHNPNFFLFGFGTKGPSDLQVEELESLVGKFAFRAAEAMIASWPDKAHRAEGYSYLTLQLAMVGELRPALLLLTERAELRDLETLSDGSIRDLAQTWARAGWGDRAQELLARIDPGDSDDLKKIKAIAAAVAGDFDTASDLHMAISDIERRHDDTFIVMEAYLTSGQMRPQDFVGALPADLRPSAIAGIGLYQAQTGDLEGALATHDRLRAIGATDLPFDLRAQIAPLLAAMGRVDEAVMMAQEVGQAMITAEVARQIK